MVKPAGSAISGDAVATAVIAGITPEVQAIVPIDDTGHIIGSKDLSHFLLPSQVHVAAANAVHWDLWNADAAKLVRIMSILQIPNVTTAVTGIVFDWLLERTTSIGTGGSAITAWVADTNVTHDVDVTCRSKPSGGAAASTDLRNYSISSEETAAATLAIAAEGGLELVPPELIRTGQGILLRPSQGVRCVQVTNSVAGNTGWLISVSIE